MKFYYNKAIDVTLSPIYYKLHKEYYDCNNNRKDPYISLPQEINNPIYSIILTEAYNSKYKMSYDLIDNEVIISIKISRPSLICKNILEVILGDEYIRVCITSLNGKHLIEHVRKIEYANYTSLFDISDEFIY